MSTTPNSPFYPRAYKVVVNHNGTDITLTNSDWEPQALRARFSVEFKVSTNGPSWWWGEVDIWNLAPTTEQTLLGSVIEQSASMNTPINQGDLLTISAGYQSTFDASANIVFQGNILQPMWDRENVTDFKTTLRAIINPLGIEFQSIPLGPLQTQASIIQRMAAAANTRIEYLDSSALSPAKLPRSKSVFGTASDIIAQAARTGNLAMWVSQDGLNVRTLQASSQAPDFVFGPSAAGTNYNPVSSGVSYTPTLIGTPQQTQAGVNFRVLMDSRLKLGSIVQLNQSVIRQLPRYPGSAALSLLDQDGSYVVAGVKHIGDTRGQEWYSDITGVTLNFWSLFAPQLTVAQGGSK